MHMMARTRARTGTRVGTPISPGDATVRAPETVPVLLKNPVALGLLYNPWIHVDRAISPVTARVGPSSTAMAGRFGRVDKQRNGRPRHVAPPRRRIPPASSRHNPDPRHPASNSRRPPRVSNFPRDPRTSPARRPTSTRATSDTFRRNYPRWSILKDRRSVGAVVCHGSACARGDAWDPCSPCSQSSWCWSVR